MSLTFLALTNRVLKAFNEVNLTSSTFANAEGFHAEVKDAINMAIVDIYTEEDNEWPFAWDDQTFDTVIGTQTYTKPTGTTTVDWESFRLEKPQVTISSLTQTSGTATANTSSAHYLAVGDQVYIRGANETDYNGFFNVLTVPSTTQFTFAVSSSATTPATGTIVCFPPFPETKLFLLSYDQYRNQRLAQDRNNINPTAYVLPRYVVRLPDNNILLSGKPDRVYPIVYDAFSIPTALSAYNDIASVPDIMQQAIVDKALHYAYMFRDNVEEAAKVEDRYKDNIHKYRRILIDQPYYMRFE